VVWSPASPGSAVCNATLSVVAGEAASLARSLIAVALKMSFRKSFSKVLPLDMLPAFACQISLANKFPAM
jgi:hypothetical protein